MATDRLLPDSVSPLMPTSATLATLASRLAQLRAGVALLLCSARPKSRLVSVRPTRSAEAPLLPAKPPRPVPPMASRRVATVLPSASCTLSSRRSMARLPLALKKSNTPSDNVPLARSSSPALPGMASVMLVLLPVGTASAVAP